MDDLGVKPAAGDLVFIRAKVVDAKGNLVATSGQAVQFTAGGAYEIVGPATVTTEAGIASALVRVAGDKSGKVGKGAIKAVAGTLRGSL